MISLKDQDRFDGSVSGNYMTKAEQLKAVVGLCFSDNYSSTGRSRLVEYKGRTGICFTEEVASEYKCNTTKPKPGLRRQPDWLVWNGFFY